MSYAEAEMIVNLSEQEWLPKNEFELDLQWLGSYLNVSPGVGVGWDGNHTSDSRPE